VTGAFGGNKSSSSCSFSRSLFSLHRVGNKACSNINTYSFYPFQGLFGLGVLLIYTAQYASVFFHPPFCPNYLPSFDGIYLFYFS
jgi:hypothetical protein